MTNLNRELRNRLYCLYRYSNKTNSDNILSLNEKHGIPDVVDILTMTFGEILSDFLKDNVEAGIKDGTIDIRTISFASRLGMRFYKLPLFFKHITVYIEYNLAADEERFNFSYDNIDENYDLKTGNLYKINITGILYLKDGYPLQDIIERAEALFAHELIHAYEDYNLQKRMNGSLLTKNEKSGYFRNSGRKEIGVPIDKKRFSYIVYFLNPTEIRAYTTQIIKNIEPKIKYCSNSQEAFNLVKNTVTWKNYLAIEYFLDRLAKYKFIDASEQHIEYWWQEITGKKNDYKDIILRLRIRMEKAKKKIINVIGKQIYDNAIKNGLWGMTDDTDNLINI